MTVSGPSIAILGAVVESIASVTVVPDHLLKIPLPVVLGAFLIVNFFLLGAYNFLIYPNLVSPLRHLPGPKGGLPLIGNVLTLFETPPGTSFHRWMQTIKNDGLIRFQALWNKDALLVTSPAAIAEILVTKTYQFEKPEHGREHLRRVLGDGLVCVEGDVHKFQRKRIMPSFAFRHIKELYPVMWSKGETLCQRIHSDFQGSDSVTIDLTEWANKATLDAIGVAALGRDFNSIYNAEDELANLYSNFTKPTRLRQAYFALSVLFGPSRVEKLPLPLNKTVADLSIRLREICRQFVNDKREAIVKRGDDHYDILSVLIKSNDFNDTELVDQMLTFLAAGSDTTSLTFTWTCFLLAKYPHIQKKLRDELMSVRDQIESVSSEHGTLATLLESLPYLNGICQETLRLYPTVPMTIRVSNADTTVLGHPIPRGTEIIFSMVAVNRSIEFWGPDAADFKPERWIDAETGKPNNHGGAINNYCLLTFLAGPRSCIGQNFARAELRCLLATWVLNFEMEDVNPREPIPIGAVTTKPMGGMWLKLREVQTKA